MKNFPVDLSNRQDAVLRAFVEMGRSFMQIRNAETLEFHQLGLTIGQFSVLEILTHRGEQSVGAIMKLMFSTPGTITLVIKNLEYKGLIETFGNVNDKRSKMARITDGGKKVVDDMWLTHKELLESFFVNLTDNEIAILAKLLRKMRKPKVGRQK